MGAVVVAVVAFVDLLEGAEPDIPEPHLAVVAPAGWRKIAAGSAGIVPAARIDHCNVQWTDYTDTCHMKELHGHHGEQMVNVGTRLRHTCAGEGA